MKANSQIDQAVYEAAHDTAVFVDRSNLGMLKITGETRLDLIDRMSTQKVKQLKSGEGTATILTTDIGRIIDRILVYASSDTAYVLTGENNADNIARYLMRYVFFNDDFHVQDISDETAIFGVYGPKAKEKLATAKFVSAATPELPRHHWRQVEVTGLTVYLHRTDPVAGDGYFVMCQQDDKEALQQHLLDNGLMLADEAVFELLRIESRLPRFGHELTNDYIPLEANLWDDVSFNKGCYIGQEIIARLESRGRLAKRLVQLRPSQPVEAGTDIRTDGKKAGVVTSTAVGPDGPLVLGFVKTAVLAKDNPSLSAGSATLTVDNA